MVFQRVKGNSWVTEKFADGSIAVFDRESKGVYFLNASAGAAWEACGEGTGVAAIACGMQTTLKAPVTEDTALRALVELEEKGLVESSDVAALASRRSALRTIGATAAALAPVVLAMTAAEQKAYAEPVGSFVNNPSDIRLKEDIRLVTQLFGMNLYTFRFIGSPAPRIGLIAQEVYDRYPEAVMRGGADPATEPWKIDYAKLVRLLGDPQAYVLAELALANS